MLTQFGLRPLPRSGVIYVSTEAYKAGYSSADPHWANLGQGAPETKSEELHIESSPNDYAPVDGIKPLRQAVADYYNTLFRKDKQSKYTYKNVSITPGGRAGLTRIITALGSINVGHFIPDYTAYEELLTAFNQFNSIPIMLKERSGFKIATPDLENEIKDRGLGAILFSNPGNPTSAYTNSDTLKEWCQLSNTYNCTLIADEYYSHFLYDKQETINSIASHINDVNQDGVIILNGVTKNWCLPGWRIGWIVAPEPIIETISSAGSFLDGGASHPLQSATLNLLNGQDYHAQAHELQALFKTKRDYLIPELKKMNIIPTTHVEAGFYVWADTSKLPKPIRNGLDFFKAGLKHKVITVPGVFFNINPGQRRAHERFENYVRISFGPTMQEVKRGVRALNNLINSYS